MHSEKMCMKPRALALVWAALLVPGGQGLVPHHRPLHRKSSQAIAIDVLASAVAPTAEATPAVEPRVSPTSRPSLAVDDASVTAEESSSLPPWQHTLSPDERSVSPLLYSDFFEWTQALLEQQPGVQRQPLAPELALAVNEAKGARCGSVEYSTDHFRKVRMTYFDAGSKVQVFNCLWYPRYHLDAPVLGVDLMCFGNRAVLAVVDCQPLGGRSTSSSSNAAVADEEGEVEGGGAKNGGLAGTTAASSSSSATSSSRGSSGGSSTSTSSSSSLGESNPFEAVRAAYPTLQGKMSGRYYDANQFFSDHMLFGRFEHPGAALATQAAASAKGKPVEGAVNGGGEGGAATATAATATAAAPTAAEEGESPAVNWAPLLAEHPIQAELFPAFQQYCSAYLDLVAGVAYANSDLTAAAASPLSSSSPSSPPSDDGADDVSRRRRSMAAVEASVKAKQEAYDQYSANRDPAHALFQTYFGDEFADQFMHEFLFAHSDPAVTAAYHADVKKSQQKEAAKSTEPTAAAGTSAAAPGEGPGSIPHASGASRSGSRNPFA